MLPIYTTAEMWSGALAFQAPVSIATHCSSTRRLEQGEIAVCAAEHRVLIACGPGSDELVSCSIWALALDDVTALAGVRLGDRVALLEADSDQSNSCGKRSRKAAANRSRWFSASGSTAPSSSTNRSGVRLGQRQEAAPAFGAHELAILPLLVLEPMPCRRHADHGQPRTNRLRQHGAGVPRCRRSPRRGRRCGQGAGSSRTEIDQLGNGAVGAGGHDRKRVADLGGAAARGGDCPSRPVRKVALAQKHEQGLPFLALIAEIARVTTDQ